MTDQELIRCAIQVRHRSYAPYAHFHVGAALLSKSGKVFTGCNLENAAFSPTICAERAALAKAVSEGEHEFTAIAIVGGKNQSISPIFTTPCGVCRQALYEFGGATLRVILARSEDDYQAVTLGELLPLGFGPANLEK